MNRAEFAIEKTALADRLRDLGRRGRKTSRSLLPNPERLETRDSKHVSVLCKLAAPTRCQTNWAVQRGNGRSVLVERTQGAIDCWIARRDPPSLQSQIIWRMFRKKWIQSASRLGYQGAVELSAAS